MGSSPTPATFVSLRDSCNALKFSEMVESDLIVYRAGL